MVTNASTIESVDHASSRTRGRAREERLSPGGLSYRYKRLTTKLLMDDFSFRRW